MKNVFLPAYNYSFYKILLTAVLPIMLSSCFLLFLLRLALCVYFACGFYLAPFLLLLY